MRKPWPTRKPRIHVNPKSGWTYGLRSQFWQDAGDHVRAVADLDEALHIDPKYTWAYCERARVRFKMSEVAKATQDWEKAVAIYVSFPCHRAEVRPQQLRLDFGDLPRGAASRWSQGGRPGQACLRTNRLERLLQPDLARRRVCRDRRFDKAVELRDEGRSPC